MQWMAWLVLVLVAAPVVFADGIGRTNVHLNNYLDSFNAYFNSGICDYDVSPSAGERIWPSDSACTTSGAYLYRGNTYLQVSSPGTFDSSKRATLGYYYEDLFFNDRDVFVIGSVPLTSFNDFTRTDIPSIGRAFPVFSFGWCGQDVRVTYANSTVAPTSAFHTDSDDTSPSCPSSWINNAFGFEQNSDGFFTSTPAGNRRPFTLPLQTSCQSYAVRFDDATHNEWPAPGTVRTLSANNGYRFSHAAGPDTMEISLTVNGTDHLQSIYVEARDGSPNYGGSMFTIYCVKTEPQLVQAECTAPNAWSPEVHTSNPGYACCGAAPVESGDIIGNYQCIKQPNGDHTWNDVTDVCSYPSGWRIGSLSTAEIKGDARTTYREGLCCSNPINHGRVLSDGTVCAALPNNYSRWMDPTVNATVERISEHDTRMLVSDGSEWITCNAAMPQPIQVAATTPPLAVDAGACADNTAATAQCAQQYNQCDAGCYLGGQPEDICRETCQMDFDSCMVQAQNSASCPSAELTCNSQNICVCPSGESWDAASNSCVGACPQGTTLQNGECTGTITYTPPSFSNATTCELVQGPGIEYICFDRWRNASESAVHYLGEGNSPLILNDKPNPDKQQAMAACIGGTINTNKQFNPTKNDFGFCGPNECYLGAAGVVCQLQDTWTDNDYCTAANNRMEWETRTRFLADALVNTTNNAPFVLHCDSTAEALNDPARPLLYENAELVKSFCILSDGNGADPIVGVTLNDPMSSRLTDGDRAIQAFQNPLRPFVTALNNSQEFGTIPNHEPCANTYGSTQYEQCDGFSDGNVYYNSAFGTLVFSETAFTPQANFLTPLLSWWNSVRFGSTQQLMPLTGHKIYFAKGNGQSIQARLYYTEPNGEEEAKIVAVNMPNVKQQCDYAATQVSSKYTCSHEVSTGTTIVTITRPTQTEWESFTLRVRP